MDNRLLDDLTPAQREAVTHMNGPMLVVAGAGSGKTRVVTRRVAHLIGQGIRPWRILALTFTNKAAREMRDRVAALVGEAPAWMGTFHSICARFLRSDIQRLDAGRDGRFSIMDQGDQEGLVKQALKRLNAVDKRNKPSMFLAAIGKAKAELIPPERYAPSSWRDELVANVYSEYETALRANNALDFDDLLVMTSRLLDGVPEVLEKYRARFPYILVDEYQDTNHVQYRLLRALAGPGANLHATGDPDQSIYSWRGADYRNIMDFKSDFPGTRLVRLEENYRSSGHILDVANHLIRHNSHRLEKNLFTSRPKGDKVTVARLQADRMEAAWVAGRLGDLRGEKTPLREMAVFYRTNAQSRSLEEALMREGIPYQLIGGVRFYERREIKDLLAHLKARVNPRDETSLRRLAAARPGIGARSLDKIVEAAAAADQSVFEFLASPGFAGRFKGNRKMLDFAGWCAGLAEIDASRADVAVKRILAHSGLVEATLAAAHKDELSEERLENLHSLAARAGEFVAMRLENASASGAEAGREEAGASAAVDLAAFLEDVALVADVDGWSGDADKATLMTLHSAKGLEFDHVFITGLEEGLLPHRNCRDDKALEEERRLFYVGVTRARKHVSISYANSRFIYGNVDFCEPSRFLDELPEDALEETDLGDSLSPDFGSGFESKRRRFPGANGGFDDFGDPDFPDMDVDFDPNPDFPPDPDPDFDGGFGAPGDASGRHMPAKRNAPPAREKSRFKAGDLVMHPEFGSGKVLMVEKRKIMVQFFISGTRLLHEDLARLTRE